MAKNKNIKNNSVPQVTLATPQRTVRILASDLYRRTLAGYSKQPRVLMALAEFLAFKRKDPTDKFGNKDKPFTNGDLRGYMHAGLSHDIQVVYTLSGKDPQVIVLHGIFSHDELGTGNPPRQTRQAKAAASFKAARGVQPLDRIDEGASVKYPLLSELLRL